MKWDAGFKSDGSYPTNARIVAHPLESQPHMTGALDPHERIRRRGLIDRYPTVSLTQHLDLSSRPKSRIHLSNELIVLRSAGVYY